MSDIQLRIGDSAQAVYDGKTITIKILNAFFSFGALEGVVLTIWHDVDGESHETNVTLRELQQWFSKIKWTKLLVATELQEEARWEPIDAPIICACPDPRCQITITPMDDNNMLIETGADVAVWMHLPDGVKFVIARSRRE